MPGFWSRSQIAIAVYQADDDGLAMGGPANPVRTSPLPLVLTAGTDRSGTATTSSASLAAANANRVSLTIQNIGANNIGVNEFGGTAAIGAPGTWTIAPGGAFKVSTNRLVTVIAATASTAFTATEN